MNCTYASYNADIAFSELLEGWPVLVDGYVIETYGTQDILMNWGSKNQLDNTGYSYGINASWYAHHLDAEYRYSKKIIYDFI